MSSLTSENGWHRLRYNAGLMIGLDFMVEATATSEAYPAMMQVACLSRGGEDHISVPIPSSAVSRKLAELFTALAEDMDVKEGRR